MSYTALVDNLAPQREVFFKLLFGNESEGYLNISLLDHANRKDMDQQFFSWPDQADEMFKYISSRTTEKKHFYFSPILFSAKARRLEYAKTCTSIWADLDTCHPNNMLIQPSITLETSPNRFQAFWTLEQAALPEDAEDIARRIAYYHKAQGADTSGWDLTQLLRIPYTLNHKYGNLEKLPLVTVLDAARRLYRVSEMAKTYPQVPVMAKIAKQEMPEVADLDLDRFPVLRDDERFSSLYYNPPGPGADWSERLWALELVCFEAGLTDNETFQIVKKAACNKYERDGRPDEALWRDVQRARMRRAEKISLVPTAQSTFPSIISDEEVELIRNRQTFVERYIHWGTTSTDAAKAYHQAGAFMNLSGLLSGNLELKTSFGRIIPNMWFMILGETTLTRKTTAVNMAMKLLFEVSESAMMASDGSIEGIFSSLAERPGEPSIFLRDEFTGFIESIMKKDYLAGFAEQLTKLYDGDRIKRVLRKETIDVRDPVFLMFVSGIKEKTQQILTEELVNGGFIPRFVMICGDPDPDNMKEIGPPTEQKDEAREALFNEMLDMYNHYVSPTELTSQGRKLGSSPRNFQVTLTQRAWARYNHYEREMIKNAVESGLPYLTPMYDRLCKSTLKAAMLIAASMQRKDQVIVDEIDLVHAIFYARQWREYCAEIVNNVGSSMDERLMGLVLNFIRSAGILGVPRSEILKKFHLDIKRADLLLKTLEHRDEIYAEAKRYYVIV